MTKGKFGILKAAIPGMDKHLAAAPPLGGKLQGLQQLAPAFEKLGLKPKMITKFMPVVVNYLQGSSSPGAAHYSPARSDFSRC